MTDLVFIEQKPMAGKERPFQPGSTIGREGCEIVLADPEVSRRHAVLREVDSGPAVEDLGSMNGTFVNGKRTSGIVVIKEGDSIRLGNTVWRLETRGAATRLAQSPPATEVAQSPSATMKQPSRQAVGPPTGGPSAAPEAPTARDVPASEISKPMDQRGDVPAQEEAPSAIKRALPPVSEQPPRFSPESPPVTRASAARRLEATLVAYAVVLATAIAVAYFFIQR